MLSQSIINSIHSPLVGLTRFGGSRYRVFGAVYGQLPAAINVPSRKAYPRDIPADATITVSAGSQYRLNGADWTSDPRSMGY